MEGGLAATDGAGEGEGEGVCDEMDVREAPFCGAADKVEDEEDGDDVGRLGVAEG